MKVFKKVLASLLCAVMIFGTVTVAVSAVTDSGTCGDNLTWSFDTETGELVIDGTGDMWDWGGGLMTPWSDLRSSILKVTIGNSVTSIGDRAFCDYNITSVSIGDSVRSIGNEAFSGCPITSVEIGKSVTVIEPFAFAYCVNLASVILPDSVERISDAVFEYCISLSSVSIGSGIISIGNGAFCLCYEITDVYYTGNEVQWNNISIGSYNESLTDATVHFAKDRTASFTVSSGKVHPGKTVEVTVNVDNNPGIIATKISLSFDDEVLTLTEVHNGEIFADSQMTKGNDVTKVPYTVLWRDSLSESNNTNNGTLVTFVFTASESASECTVDIDIEYDRDSTFDSELNNVEFTVEGGKVEIVSRIPGDTDGDGVVTLKDVIIMERYLADWDVTITDMSNADVDGDGTLTLKDVVLVERYLADWDVELT